MTTGSFRNQILNPEGSFWVLLLNKDLWWWEYAQIKWPDIFIREFHLVTYGSLGPLWHPTPVLLPGKSHGRRSLVGYSPLGREESDTTERLHVHFSLSCIGEGNGNPLQCSWLKNPRDCGAWWAAVYGVAQSRTRLTRQQQQQQP